MGEIARLDILNVRVRADPAAEGGFGEARVLLDQLLLPDARLRQAGLVQPLHIVQAQPLRVQALLICSRRALCQMSDDLTNHSGLYGGHRHQSVCINGTPQPNDPGDAMQAQQVRLHLLLRCSRGILSGVREVQ